MDNPKFLFPSAKQHAFVFENAHLLLLSYDRDNARFLFLIKGQENEELILDYPGQTFVERVLDMVQNIFFIQVQEEGEDAKPYVLGSYFETTDKSYGAYYERDVTDNPNVVLFQLHGESPDFTLEVPNAADYEQAANAFTDQHNDLMNIQSGKPR